MSPPTLRAHDDRVVRFVGDYTDERGYGPSFREVADGIGLSLAQTHAIVDRLVDEDRLTNVPKIPRTLRVSPREELHQ